ncbi:M13 family metallopeptidase [Pseudonocardia spinosispora]|uniref:M13 family metallopeptidase n=1 Tax=Pseudonocardia spinosispora TaxID=103441 RepID=UPI001B7F94E1|nr:M13-type metalloendopeptidase [Pseudonocardia spinosispora]
MARAILNTHDEGLVYMRRQVVALGVVAVVAFSSACGSQPPPPPPPPSSGLDLAGFDRSVRAQDDLFEFANGGWLKNTPIPADRSEYGTDTMLALRAGENQRDLIQQAGANTEAPANSDERKIGDLYASFMDTGRLDRLRADSLTPDFAAVDRISNPADLVRHLGAIQRAGASNPIGLSVNQDAKDATAYITEISQSGTSLPDRDYYLSTDPGMVALRDKYRAYTAKMFGLAGLPDPDGSAARILDLETKLAQAQWTETANRDAVATYNKFAVADATRTTGLDWAAYLDAAGIHQPNLVIDQPSYFTALNGLLSSVPLDTWKQYLKWHLLEDYAPCLSDDFVTTSFDFTGKVLGGKEQNQERWRRGVAAVNSVLGEAIGKLYVAKYFAPETKQRAEALVGNLLDAYRDSIDKLDWMTPATKVAAKEKLSKLTVKIGYPDRWRDYSSLVIKRDDLVGNLHRAREFDHQYAIDKLGKPIDREEWDMTPQTVNAYYSPSMNEIVFPAAILQPPYFDAKADDAVNYGGIGATIGHEISHAFDDQGSKYDASGNLRDWWTPADGQAFAAKTGALVSQFNAYEPLPGTHINGQLTLGENIADLSGLVVAHRAYLKALDGKQAPVLDGFTGEQRFWLGYAQSWRGKSRDEATRQQLLADEHSPVKFRTNGPVSNADPFYQAFDLHPGDKLYRPDTERVRLW